MEIFETEFGEKKLTVKIGDLAEQANGEVLIQYGDTTLLVTAVMKQKLREGIDFFPLTVEYVEKYYAAGKIRGSRFIRREARPSDEAVLVGRMVDRTIRPRFSQKIKNEVQIILTCLSWDAENDPDIPAIFGASLALSISDIPWQGPVAGVRIGKANGQLILNPSYQERDKSSFDLVAAACGDKNGETLINMVEAEGDEVAEEEIMEAAEWSLEHLKKLLDFQNEIIKKVGKEKIKTEMPELDKDAEKEIKKFLDDKLEKALYQEKKQERNNGINKLREELVDFVEKKYPGEEKIKLALDFFEEEVSRVLHKIIIEKEKRPDGRKLNEIRKIDCRVGILPRTHGSALFTRGETQSLSILTLGAPGDVQLIEGMEIVGKKRFMHHYNFPPYCTGETGPLRGPGRREIGHGALAEKALLPLVPDKEVFPYTIRVVSEILSSNGSSSMASTTSSSLALFDAGVPIKEAITGIALGLVVEDSDSGIANKKYKILTDIQGPEDYYCDMDFKVAGTKNGITAIQLDVKILGLTFEIFKDALSQAKEARISILEKMAKVLDRPRSQLSSFAPRILTIQIHPDKIREVIGPGGKIINEIVAQTGATIDIEDTGLVSVTGETEESANKAISWIKNITREAQIGEVFMGKVIKILDFGAVVEIFPGKEGLVHISELAPYRVEKVEDIIRMGDIVPVKVLRVEDSGKISLSLKRARKEDEKEIK